MDADAVINDSSQKVGGSNACPDPAPKKVGVSGPRKTHRIYAPDNGTSLRQLLRQVVQQIRNKTTTDLELMDLGRQRCELERCSWMTDRRSCESCRLGGIRVDSSTGMNRQCCCTFHHSRRCSSYTRSRLHINSKLNAVSSLYGNSRAIRDHTVLPATRQRRHYRLYPSRSWYSIKRPRRDARLS